MSYLECPMGQGAANQGLDPRGNSSNTKGATVVPLEGQQ